MFDLCSSKNYHIFQICPFNTGIAQLVEIIPHAVWERVWLGVCNISPVLEMINIHRSAAIKTNIDRLNDVYAHVCIQALMYSQGYLTACPCAIETISDLMSCVTAFIRCHTTHEPASWGRLECMYSTTPVCQRLYASILMLLMWNTLPFVHTLIASLRQRSRH